MTSLTLTSTDPAQITADVLVLGVAAARAGGEPRLVAAGGLPDSLVTSLSGALKGLGVSGKADSVQRIPAGPEVAATVIALVGLGSVDGVPTPEALRRAAGAAARALAGTATVAVALPADDRERLAAVAEGALLGAYAFRAYRHVSAATVPEPVTTVIVATPLAEAAPEDADRTAARARVLADAVHATRDLINTPPLDLFPAEFAERAVRAVADLPVSVTVLDEQELVDGGYGGLVGVGMGSSRPPRLVRLDYTPEGADTHLALVGKGITFDSGGLSIKPAASMEAMKSDMSGAAAVLHAVVAAARLALPLRVSGWLALAENMPSGTAQRPSDVLTIRGGTTVEVLNTDAEGRLVLADALVAASETAPDVIVDVATLTGAQMVALGSRVSAIMSNDDALRERLHRLADACGEQFWPMPLPAELRASLDSPVADLANMGDRFGGMLVAGLFLKEFVGNRPAPEGEAGGNQADPATSPPADPTTADRTPDTDEDGAEGIPPTGSPIPWAHLDIAGPSFNTGSAHGYTPVGGTGVAVRTLLALAEELATTGV